MAESDEQRIGRLMAEGLDHYGQDRVEKAVECWREVLRLKPSHRVARDYLDAAGFTGGAESAPAPARARVSVCAEALGLYRAGETSEAISLLETSSQRGAEELELQATLDLLRSHLHSRYCELTGGGTGIPGVKLAPAELIKFNLPPNAGFLLSMIDGNTSVDELVTLSGMDPFDALHVLHQLVDARIVEVKT